GRRRRQPRRSPRGANPQAQDALLKRVEMALSTFPEMTGYRSMNESRSIRVNHEALGLGDGSHAGRTGHMFHGGDFAEEIAGTEASQDPRLIAGHRFDDLHLPGNNDVECSADAAFG